MSLIYLKISFVASTLTTIKHKSCKVLSFDKIARTCPDNELIAGICSADACPWNLKCCQVEAYPVHREMSKRDPACPGAPRRTGHTGPALRVLFWTSLIDHRQIFFSSLFSTTREATRIVETVVQTYTVKDLIQLP